MTSFRRQLVGIVFACSLAGWSLSAWPAQQPRTVVDGVFTAQQATRGQALYKTKCLSCHGEPSAGRTGPPLAGEDFVANWEAHPLLELANKIRRTMPKDDTPRLSGEETVDLLAYILQAGDFPAGAAELTADETALARIAFPMRTAITKPAPTQMPALPPSGTVAQVMRGILFPSANIVFTVQSIDPGVRKPPSEDNTGGGFDWLTWGGSVYRGWEVVDYAAISVAESAALMLTPGRRCENGRPVPVDDPDWVRFTLELAEAGKASYKAAQTRNQQTVSDSTNQLNESCSNCHRVFRGRVHCVKAGRP